MNNLFDFHQFIGALLLGFINGWLIYKFLIGLGKDKQRKKEDKQIISKFLEMMNIKEIVAINEFNDRYFIRLTNPMDENISLDLRVYKDTQELEIGIPSKNNRRFPLSDKQYSQFLDILNQVE